jgi:hypothetical protein
MTRRPINIEEAATLTGLGLDYGALIQAGAGLVQAGSGLLSEQEKTKQARQAAAAAEAQARAAASGSGRSSLPFGLTPITASVAAVGGVVILGAIIYALTRRK